MLRDELLEFGYELCPVTHAELGVDVILDRREPRLLQPRDLTQSERLKCKLPKWRAAPQRKCGSEVVYGGRGVPAVGGVAPCGYQALKAIGIQFTGLNPQDVAACAPHQPITADELA